METVKNRVVTDRSERFCRLLISSKCAALWWPLSLFWLFVLTLSFLVTPSRAAQEKEEDPDTACLECHLDPNTTKTVAGKEVSLVIDHTAYKTSVHAEEGCDSCHEDFDAAEIPHRDAIEPVSCNSCHSEAEDEGYEDSAHGPADDPAAGCTDCHGTHDIHSSSDPKSRLYNGNIVNTCGTCHEEVADDFKHCPHWKANQRESSEGPGCAHCHSAHGTELITKAVPGEGTSNDLCTRCHLSGPEKVLDLVHVKPEFVIAYEQSVHGTRDTEGNVPALCVDCHGPHRVGTRDDPGSSLSRRNTAETCGHCHSEETKVYQQSIHGTELARGETESATCTDCHGEHLILPKEAPTSGLRGRLLAVQTCGSCHTSVTLARKYGFSAERLKTYRESYHGLAVDGGSVSAADCASCHGYHNILPSSDPASLIHPDNLEKTCGKCHEGASKTFAMIPVHAEYTRESHFIAYVVKWAYIWMIILVIGGMLLHNLIIYSYYVRRKLHQEKSFETHQRFLPFELVQHALLIISFTILVITGFALKFPDAFWVEGLQFLGISEEIRSIIHRIAGCVLILLSIVQLGYFILHRRGRAEVRALIPLWKDVSDAWGNILFHLGLRSEHPRYDRYSYAEKAEYLALIWGTAIMAVTGLVLWFPEYAAPWAPWWLFDVCQVIHYYEAWLATLAIIVWHLFFVVFHPQEYPLCTIFLTGRMSKEQWQHHHPLEYERQAEKSTDPEG